jgi:hypothetical protein
MDKVFDIQVMAFLDGSMDNADRIAFLREVHSDQEKLDVLTQYRRLDNAFELSRRPIDVPIELQQSLSARIPALHGTRLPSSPVVINASLETVASRRKSRVAAITIVLLLLAVISYISLEHLALRDGDALTRGRNADRAQSQSAVSEREFAAASPNKAPASASDRNHAYRSSGGAGPISSRTSSLSQAGPSAVGYITDTSIRNTEPIAYPLDPDVAGTDIRMAAAVPTTDMVSLGFGALPPGLTVYVQSGLLQPLTSGTLEQSDGTNPAVLLAGVRYEIAPRFSAMLEIGQSSFLQETLLEKRSALVGSNNADLLIIDRAVIPDVRNWLRFQLGYQLIEVAAWQIELRGGSGILLGEEQEILFTSGVMAHYALSQLLQARIGIQFSGARLAPRASVPATVTAGDGIVGIIQKADAARGMTSGGVEFNIGFGLRLW